MDDDFMIWSSLKFCVLFKPLNVRFHAVLSICFVFFILFSPFAAFGWRWLFNAIACLKINVSNVATATTSLILSWCLLFSHLIGFTFKFGSAISFFCRTFAQPHPSSSRCIHLTHSNIFYSPFGSCGRNSIRCHRQLMVPIAINIPFSMDIIIIFSYVIKF